MNGKGKFVRMSLMLREGKLEFTVLLNAKGVPRSADVFGCSVSAPKASRKGHPHAFRLDVLVAICI